MSIVLAQFRQRVEGIPFHGVGLSADAYQPDLYDVLGALDACGAPPEFVELFRAFTPMLAAIRARVPRMPMPYHAEGLWLTQPGWLSGERLSSESAPGDLVLAREQVRTLRSAWLNHECASKLVGGHAFGTYLPPLFTRACAAVVAAHAQQVQAFLDEPDETAACEGRDASAGRKPYGPLLLLELPPLTYFAVGDRPVGAFFRDLTEATPCGLVLDIGHLWTHYRYGPKHVGETITQFVSRFLEEFPLERVVEIHVAGLACHPADQAPAHDGEDPWWLDAHGAAIPPVLFEVLEQVLADARLTALRGVALEVDTKPVAQIAEEFVAFRQRFDPLLARRPSLASQPSLCAPIHEPLARQEMPGADLSRPSPSYAALERRYADLVLGRWARDPQESRESCEPGDPQTPRDPNMSPEPPESPELHHIDADLIRRYRDQYLPYELLHWGGDLPEMFPRTCAALAAQGIDLAEFVPFWYATRRAVPAPFDFFLLKLDRFLAFVRARLPQDAEALAVAEREADDLRVAYACANEPVESLALSIGGEA